MGHTLFCVLGLFLLSTLFHCGPVQDAALNLKPQRSTFYSGESVTFTCDINKSKEAEWNYTLNRNGGRVGFCSNKNPCSLYLRKNSSGEYQCIGRHKDFTKESNKVSLTVLGKLRPALDVSSSWLTPGASVTLSCSVTNQSAEWRFFWYKAVSTKPGDSYSYEPLPGSRDGTAHIHYTVHGQKQTAAYACRAGRGEPARYSWYSNPKFVWSGDSLPASASIKVSPDRERHSSEESVSLRCEGNSSHWRVMRLTERGHLSNCSVWGTMTGSTCAFKKFKRKAAVHWCEPESGPFSNAVNITVQSASRPADFPFPVKLVIGLVCGILLIILLLLLCRWRKSKDASQDITNFSTDSKNTGKTDDNLLYVQVYLHNKGKPSPAVMDETIYSEVKL